MLIGTDLHICIMATNAGELQEGECAKCFSFDPKCKWHMRQTKLSDGFKKALNLDRKMREFSFQKCRARNLEKRFGSK